MLLASALVVSLALYGFPYYRLPLPARVHSAYHPLLKPGGFVGVQLGFLGFLLFCGLFLYPLRKCWTWLNRIGKTKHWLDFHVLLGITAPLIITFHSAFKMGGLAGVAYWIMIAVALSGFVGRYLYAQIPRSLGQAEMSLKEMEATVSALADQLVSQAIFSKEEFGRSFRLPTAAEVRQMSAVKAFGHLIRLDVDRLMWVGALRRKTITAPLRALTLGGLLPTGNRELEAVISSARRQSWMAARMLFLSKIQEFFQLWHVVHRPFSYSFAVLSCIHVATVLLLGYY